MPSIQPARCAWSVPFGFFAPSARAGRAAPAPASTIAASAAAVHRDPVFIRRSSIVLTWLDSRLPEPGSPIQGDRRRRGSGLQVGRAQEAKWAETDPVGN